MARVLLLVWEGADWPLTSRLIASGRLPNLSSVGEKGVSGPISSIPPLEPLPLLTTLATGKSAAAHGIASGFEVRDDTIVPVTPQSLAAPPVWEIAASRALAAGALNWPLTWPVAHGPAAEIAEPFFRTLHHNGKLKAPPKDSVAPAHWEAPLDAFRLHASDITSDELAAFGLGAMPADRKRNLDSAAVAVKLAETITIQNVANWCLEHQCWDFLAVRFSALDLVARRFARFMRPNEPENRAQEVMFERFGDLLPRYFELHDLMLGHLIGMAGEDMTIVVVSPAGLRHGTPASARGREHIRNRYQPQGFMSACGPAVKPGQNFLGASILDVAPSLLRMLGLEEGADMPGRPLAEVFEFEAGRTAIETWDSCRNATAIDADARILEEVLAEYDMRPPEGVEALTLERVLNRARSLSATGRSRRALDELLAFERGSGSENPEFARILAHLLLDHECDEGIESLIGEMMRSGGTQFDHDLLQARLHSMRGQHEQALDYLFENLAKNPRHAALHVYVGEEYRRLGRREEALEAYENALECDAGNLKARLGIARIQIEARDFQAAVEAALAAIDQHFSVPEAHWLLGRALDGLGEWQRAAQAYSGSLRLAPGRADAHRALARLYEPDRLNVPALREVHQAGYARALARATISGGS